LAPCGKRAGLALRVFGKKTQQEKRKEHVQQKPDVLIVIDFN